ncbi:phosphatase PAP2 family protein [Shewanella sp. Isolate11]|uniref:phosphatase PAP2 family protein n=1 Tax=Shewanella sp. Isolate11 TaxID=2908530 RepID=UPI001EFCF4CE|nr:phosphatase PAP2 family protein [Shewanella sp. Isolate11]MCG9698222.1 phosphatase PAP2 family protein [Shewanella sp. Isolate11]
MFSTIAKLDRQTFIALNGFGHKHHLTTKAKWVSATGDGPTYLIICVSLLMLHQQGELLFNTALSAFLVELPCYLLLKNSIRRVRPCDQLLLVEGQSRKFDSCKFDFQPSDKFSLPSGHTAAAFVMATSVSTVFPSLSLWAYSWACVIGISRIILGVHYPLDIVAGALLGIASGYLAMGLIS